MSYCFLSVEQCFKTLRISLFLWFLPLDGVRGLMISVRNMTFFVNLEMLCRCTKTNIIFKNSSAGRIKGHSLGVLGFPGGSKVNIVLENI